MRFAGFDDCTQYSTIWRYRWLCSHNILVSSVLRLRSSSNGYHVSFLSFLVYAALMMRLSHTFHGRRCHSTLGFLFYLVGGRRGRDQVGVDGWVDGWMDDGMEWNG